MSKFQKFRHQIQFIDIFYNFHEDIFRENKDFLDFEKYFGINEPFATVEATKAYFDYVSNKMPESAKSKAINVAKSTLKELLGSENPKLELFSEL